MRANSEQMHMTADRVAALADEFWNDVDSLRKEADGVMTADWVGDASESHAALWAEWVQSARAVVGALSGDAGLLHHAADQYHASDSETADHISSLNLGPSA